MDCIFNRLFNQDLNLLNGLEDHQEEGYVPMQPTCYPCIIQNEQTVENQLHQRDQQIQSLKVLIREQEEKINTQKIEDLFAAPRVKGHTSS